MGENIFIFLWFCGGFFVAFVFLLIATIIALSARSHYVLRSFCLVLAFCGLIYEGGCFAVASDIGKATGGGGDNGKMNNIIGASFVIAIVWSGVILSLPSDGKDKQEIGKENDVA